MVVPHDKKQAQNLASVLSSNNMKLVAQIWESVESDEVDDAIAFLENSIERSVKLNPVYINSQTGKDYFNFEENARILKAVELFSETYKIKIVHELHRGKFSYHPLVAFEYYSHIPSLELTADLSHWVNVTESNLESERLKPALDETFKRTRHIHARVGFVEGPQITDPRAPEWQEQLMLHMKWWGDIIQMNMDQGFSEVGITPEFGPYPYMIQHPYTKKDIADLWEINVYMKIQLTDYLKKRFGDQITGI